MRENKIPVRINKSLEDVFKFTTNPEKTHLWIPSIVEEISEKYPPRVGTLYKNHGENSDWDCYIVSEFEKNKIFTLTDLKGIYTVRYTYEELDKNQTKMEYFEWMREGELKNPFTQDILLELKSIIEDGVLF